MIWPEDDRVRRAFAATAKRYDDHARRRFRRIAKVAIGLAGVTRKDRILDVACGSGLVGRVLKETGLPEPVGLDISSALLQLAPLQHRVAADALAMPFPENAFDVVLCNAGLQMLEDSYQGLAEMHRVLRPGGKIAVSIWGDPGSTAPLDEAAYQTIDRLLKEQPDYDPERWRATQTVIDDEPELRKALEEAGFIECRSEVRRKRSAFKNAEHYFDMLTIFPTAWVRLEVLGRDRASDAREQAVREIRRVVGHDGPFEVEEESIIAGATKPL